MLRTWARLRVLRWVRIICKPMVTRQLVMRLVAYGLLAQPNTMYSVLATVGGSNMRDTPAFDGNNHRTARATTQTHRDVVRVCGGGDAGPTGRLKYVHHSAL